MLGLGLTEILLIAGLILVVVGPERLPEVMRFAGRIYGQLRRASDDLRRAFVLEADKVDAERRYEELRKRRERLMEERRKAQESGAVAQLPTLEAPDAPPPEPTTDDEEQAS